MLCCGVCLCILHTHIYILVSLRKCFEKVFTILVGIPIPTWTSYTVGWQCVMQNIHILIIEQNLKSETLLEFTGHSHMNYLACSCELSRVDIMLFFSHTSSPTLKTDAGRFLKKEKIKLQLLLLWQRQGRKSKTSS